MLINEESFDQKKRKWEPDTDGEVQSLHGLRESKLLKETIKEVDVELYLNTTLPPDWKQCPYFESRKKHLYNTTTHGRANQYRTRHSWDMFPDPPQQYSASCSAQVSLELELNLPDGSSRAAETSNVGTQCGAAVENRRAVGRSTTAKSLSLVGLGNEEQKEMMATVCMRCHMLVMLCKSSPCCPNCKFMHTPAPNPPLNLLNLLSDLRPLDQSSTTVTFQGLCKRI